MGLAHQLAVDAAHDPLQRGADVGELRLARRPDRNRQVHLAEAHVPGLQIDERLAEDLDLGRRPEVLEPRRLAALAHRGHERVARLVIVVLRAADAPPGALPVDAAPPQDHGEVPVQPVQAIEAVPDDVAGRRRQRPHPDELIADPHALPRDRHVRRRQPPVEAVTAGEPVDPLALPGVAEPMQHPDRLRGLDGSDAGPGRQPRLETGELVAHVPRGVRQDRLENPRDMRIAPRVPPVARVVQEPAPATLRRRDAPREPPVELPHEVRGVLADPLRDMRAALVGGHLGEAPGLPRGGRRRPPPIHHPPEPNVGTEGHEDAGPHRHELVDGRARQPIHRQRHELREPEQPARPRNAEAVVDEAPPRKLVRERAADRPARARHHPPPRTGPPASAPSISTNHGGDP